MKSQVISRCIILALAFVVFDPVSGVGTEYRSLRSLVRSIKPGCFDFDFLGQDETLC